MLLVVGGMIGLGKSSVAKILGFELFFIHHRLLLI